MQITRKAMTCKAMAGAAFGAILLAGCGSGVSLGGSAGMGGGAGGDLGSASAAPQGSGSTGGGTQTAGNGSSGGGSASGSTGSNPTGNGTVTVTAGGTSVATPTRLSSPLVPVGTAANGLGNSLVTTGNALLPTQTTAALQDATSGLPLSANVANNSLGGAPAQPLGVSLLSATPASGTIAGANLLSSGQTAGVTVNPAGIVPALNGIAANPAGTASALSPVTSALPLTTTLGHTALTGGAGAQPIGVSVLSPSQATGTAATVGVLSGGNVVTATVNGAGTGSVLNGTASLANATMGKTNLITGANPLVGASVVSPSQNSGSLVTAGVVSNGQPLALGLGKTQILPLAGH